MFNLFKERDCNNRLLQLELEIEHQQKQIDELRTLLLALSTSLNEVQTQLNYHIDKIGKSI